MLNPSAYLIVFVSFVLRTNAEDSCSLDLSTTNVIVTRDLFSIIRPDFNETEIHLDYQEHFEIWCPPGFTHPDISGNFEPVRCEGGAKIYLKISRKYLSFHTIKCIQKHPITVKKSDIKCQHTGTSLDLGIEMSSQMSPTSTVCFDERHLVSLNATFYAPFEKWGVFSNQTVETYFVDDGHLYKDLDVNALYDNQKQIFSKLGVSKYHTEEVYLIKGQLLPPYLFTHPLEKYAAFNYANVVPQWSTQRNVFAEFVNNFIIEHNMRPSRYVVGALGEARLKNDDNVRVGLRMHGWDMPVPKWLWFTYEGSFTIYGYNNPHFEESEVEAEFKQLCVLPYSFKKFKNMLVGVCAGDIRFYMF